MNLVFRWLLYCTYLFPVDLNICDVIFENCWHVNFRELVLAEDDEEAGLSAGAVAHDHQLLTDGSHCQTLSWLCTKKTQQSIVQVTVLLAQGVFCTGLCWSLVLVDISSVCGE